MRGLPLASPPLAVSAAQREHDHDAEQRQSGEDQERQQVVDELAEGLVAVEAQLVHALLCDSRQGRYPDEGDAGEDHAAHRLTVLERDRHQLGGDTDRGQREHGDGGHRVDPADPLADPLGTAEVGLDAEPVIDEQIDDGAQQDGERQQHPQRADQGRPREERYPAHRHARCAGGEHRRRHAPGRGQQADDHQTVAAEEQVDSGVVATTDPAVAGERGERQHEAAQPRIATREGEPREGDLAGAELERHDRDREPERERDQSGEHEPDAVSLEELQQRAAVEQFRLVTALEPDHHPEHADGDHTQQAEAQVDAADPLVIAGDQPGRQPGEERHHRRLGGGFCMGFDRRHETLMIPWIRSWWV